MYQFTDYLYTAKLTLIPKIGLKNSGITLLLFLIPYYRKSVNTIFSSNISPEIGLTKPLQTILERNPNCQKTIQYTHRYIARALNLTTEQHEPT